MMPYDFGFPPLPPPSHDFHHLAEPLFDDDQAALFSSFLTTLEVDQDFLFNPVLPEGMPSPPASLPPGMGLFECERERAGLGETLSRRVDGIKLESSRADGRERRGKGKQVRRYHEEQDEEDSLVKQEDEEEDYRDGHELEEAAGVLGRGKTRRSPVNRGRNDGGRAKKARVQDDDDDDDFSAGEDEMEVDRDRDITPPTRSVKSSRANTSRAKSPLERSESVDSQGSPSSFADTKRAPLTETQKRSNHILSEQKRRNAIRSGFKDLVDLLTAGEQASGISIAAPPEPEIVELTANGKKKKSKGNGRGRGRKGEIGAGASKSVILEKAAQYVEWLARGNDGLEEELARVLSQIA